MSGSDGESPRATAMSTSTVPMTKVMAMNPAGMPGSVRPPPKSKALYV